MGRLLGDLQGSDFERIASESYPYEASKRGADLCEFR